MGRPAERPGRADGATESEPLRRLFGHELERRLLEGLGLTPGETVLELACGSGATCLRLAELVGPTGHAICSDLRPDRVEATRQRAAAAQVDGIDARVLDMLRLDLPDSSVDAILCRWGLMYAVPQERALAEAFRVLRPDKRLALAVWAEPDRNPWISLVDEALRATGHALPLDRRAPGGMFSLADPGHLRMLLAQASFDEVVVDEVPIAWEYDDLDAYWAEEALVSGPYEVYLRALPQAELIDLQGRIRSLMQPYALDSGGYRIPGVSLVAGGRR